MLIGEECFLIMHWGGNGKKYLKMKKNEFSVR